MKHKFLTWLCHFVNDFLAKRLPNVKYRCTYVECRHQHDDTD
ncbi:MAG: hypothetical protein NT098_02275 [Candidatus Parcubacteria bacterium]|nr:hypothetical protein [Candidatus Parcubacteria bacterium]